MSSLDDYIKYRIQRANETLGEVETLIENKYWNTAVNRLYYACFYSVSAFLIKYNITTSTHSGVRQKFGQVFVKEGVIDKELTKHFTDLFEKRQKGDYNDFYDFDKETVLRLFPISKTFIKTINKLTLNH